MACSGFVQEELCYRAMVTKALDQLMALLNPPQALPIENSVLQMEPQIRVC